MPTKWKEVEELNEGEYRVVRKGYNLFLEKKEEVEEWRDITKECNACAFAGANGIYIALLYHGHTVASVKPTQGFIVRGSSLYRIDQDPLSTYSFRVLRRI